MDVKEFINAFPNDLPPIPYRVKDLLDLTPVDDDIQRMHSWNPNDKSPFLQVKENNFNTVYRRPIARTTDCIRVKQGYSNGIHAWEFKWNPLKRGTHAIVGVAEKSANLRSYGYTSVVGQLGTVGVLICGAINFITIILSPTIPNHILSGTQKKF